MKHRFKHSRKKTSKLLKIFKRQRRHVSIKDVLYEINLNS